jgi:hypothetical protein
MSNVFSGEDRQIELEQQPAECSYYCPTPEQIRVECQRIQAEWSEREFWCRAGYEDGKPRWQPPISEAPIGDD